MKPLPATPPDSSDIALLVERAEALLDRIDGLMHGNCGRRAVPDWNASPAFQWRKRGGSGRIEAVRHLHQISLDDLLGIDAQRARIEQNTVQFVRGHPANNVLLTGARGTGKSSLIKALLNRYASENLRAIEVEKHDLIDLHEIVDQVFSRPEKFIVFCDDLSFAEDEPGYKALKVVLDGSLSAATDNVLIYATSNRRHLMPEKMRENAETTWLDEEIHPGETVEEKISLSERFGLWVSFYPFNQQQYLQIVAHWLGHFEMELTDPARTAALQWALGRGSRSGRVAWHFARDWAGQQKLAANRE